MARKRATSPEKIVSAAIHCFAKKGYNDTKTADIAREAKVSEGTLYNHFKDKLALFIAVVERINSVIEEEFNLESSEEDVIERYNRDLSSLEDFFRENVHYLEILVRDLRHREASRICAQFMDRLEERKRTDILALARQCGFEPNEQEVEALSVCFNGGIERLLTRWCVGGAKGEFQTSPTNFVKGFISILQRAGRKS